MQVWITSIVARLAASFAIPPVHIVRSHLQHNLLNNALLAGLIDNGREKPTNDDHE